MKFRNLCVAALAAAGIAAFAAAATAAPHARRGAVGAHPRTAAPDHSRKGPAAHGKRSGSGSTSLPAKEIEALLQVKGTVSDGVLTTSIDRSDITGVHIGSVPIEPAFEIDGSLDFQPIGNHEALFNGDIPVKPSEIDHVVETIVGNGLVFQAEHQHMYDFEPMVWFIHLRGKGDPLKLAAEVHNVLKATSTPLPQEPPEHPSTPLDKGKLMHILHGYEAEVGEDGVVTIYVARRNPIVLDGVTVKPQTNIATNISFEPLNSSGTETAVIGDVAMEAGEVDPVMSVMRSQGWDIGCLYNQETDEHPQLFFSHQFKTGDPYKLAEEFRRGLDQTNSK